MTTAEIRQLPVSEKIQLMEALWQDLRERFDQMDLPQAHKDLLDQRRLRVKQGTAKLLDWDAVKSTIGRA
jgi:putative addiction module component (TIGR02574 family)